MYWYVWQWYCIIQRIDRLHSLYWYALENASIVLVLHTTVLYIDHTIVPAGTYIYERRVLDILFGR